MRVFTILLLVTACDGGPVLTDRDAGPDAGPPITDGGVGDAGPPEVDAGPSCLTEDPTAPADPSIGEWSDRFANPGVGGDLPNVNAFAFGADGEVYVGGEFTTAGYAPALNIAAWDGGEGWRAMGEGLPGRVRSIVVDGDDVIAAHGVGDFFATRISRWDGTTWTTVADAENGSIEEIALAGTTLLAAGSFTRIGGADIAGFARLDGETWSGYGITPDATVEAISAITADDLCIGGSFSTLGAIEARYAACYDGTWHARSMPLEFYIGVFDLARDPADGSLVAGGNFMLDETGMNGGSIARWTGSAWALIGGGLTSELGLGGTKEVRGIAFAPTGMYVGGAFGGYPNGSGDITPIHAVARWDGTAWDDLGGLFKEVGFSLDQTNVVAVAAGPDGSVYFGGLFTRADSTRVAHVVRWDGTYWSALRTPGERYDGVGGSVLALAREGTCAVYVGGEFEYAGGVRANNIARYTEAGYEALGAGVIGAVTDIRALPDGRVLIGGGFVDADTGTTFANVARWDGAQWEGFGVAPEGQIWAVEAVPPASPDAADIVYAGGNFVAAGDVEARGVAMWNGTEWSEVGGGLEGYQIDPETRSQAYPYDLLIDDNGDLIVAGTFETAGGVTVNNIARWDGEAWHAYGDGLGDAFGSVLAVAMWNGRLVACGSFDERVAVWTGTAWEAVGDTTLAGFTVAALDTAGDALVAGGMFSLVEDGPYAHVAVLVGGQWRDLDAGVSDIVEAVLAMNEGIYFGGTFDRAGTSPAVGLARFTYAR
jgi:hypothetical protein